MQFLELRKWGIGYENPRKLYYAPPFYPRRAKEDLVGGRIYLFNPYRFVTMSIPIVREMDFAMYVTK